MTYQRKMSFDDHWKSSLEKALKIGQFERSTMAGQLDHIELYSFHEPHNGEIDAQPTREIRNQGKAEPDTDVLELYGWASSRIKRVAEFDPRSAEVLVAFHGDEGAKYAVGAYGRIGAVVCFTGPSAEALVEYGLKKTKGAKLELTFAQRVQSEMEIQKVRPTTARQSLIARVLVDANALYAHACDLMEAVIAGRAPARRTPPLPAVVSGAALAAARRVLAMDTRALLAHGAGLTLPQKRGEAIGAYRQRLAHEVLHGRKHIVWLREYGAAVGIPQLQGEADEAFRERLQAVALGLKAGSK